MKRRIEGMIELATALSPVKKWLIIYPASGTARRLTGKICALDVDGEIIVFIITAKEAVALDTRFLVLDDETLEVAYNPRAFVEKMQPQLKAWMKRNPDYCNSPIPKGPKDREPKRIRPCRLKIKSQNGTPPARSGSNAKLAQNAEGAQALVTYVLEPEPFTHERKP